MTLRDVIIAVMLAPGVGVLALAAVWAVVVVVVVVVMMVLVVGFVRRIVCRQHAQTSPAKRAPH